MISTILDELTAQSEDERYEMALGMSGSNGGIRKQESYFRLSMQKVKTRKNILNHIPLEVSYFINNSCNLRCKHCYVGYSEATDSLTTQEWTNLFDEVVSLGARTFGNVGKEPLISLKETKQLLEYFKLKKSSHSDLRFGFVTNGILLDNMKINELDKIMPDYIDISLDGNKEVHNFIRGEGAFEALTTNLQNLS